MNEKESKNRRDLYLKIRVSREELDAIDRKFRELADAQRTIEEYLRHEQSRDQRKRKKRNDLE